MTLEIARYRRYPELEGKTLLICVGGTKCATSWLHGYLDSLPGVTPSPLKELHFFNRKFPRLALSDMDLLATRRLMLFLSQEGNPAGHVRGSPLIRAALDRVQMIYDDNAYFGHFARICTADTKVLCDVTPAYSSIGAEGFAWMRELCAAQAVRAKILFVMRDPVTRLWSQLRHMQQQTIIDDAGAVWSKALASEAIMARGDYRRIVTALDGCFDADDILYLFYENLTQEPALQRLCRFLDVPQIKADVQTRRNETEVKTALPQEARRAFLRALAPQYAFCHARFGADLPAAWQG
ncbi:sulfotransferase [Mameliella sediminis]|uniref:sulfotransferase n=1 Tax=Mameliella sediminis TaxID=2836866 RepID=UPI001C486801|nr:sulfotransferase [Mameliella sediminis]MBV7394261.1 sulfotransferase [Mameliella sediminis]MBY6112979.1 sulfotransferase [Antarctobacter heliothermus]MBY6143673.1 sulfotransferase [Mameliella alba]MCA0952603.1 sulfotransferase [Mameliella alba]